MIVDVRASSAVPSENLWLAPALFDAQVNGFGGVDFQQDDLTADDLLRAVRGIREAGCSRFLLTLITNEWKKLTARLRHLREVRNSSPELRRAIAGWHIEGPFLSSEPGFHGTHNPTFTRDPSAEMLSEFRAITGDDPLLLTVAPERAGAIAAIETATCLGIKISLGHTNASAQVIGQAIRAGARAFTHLANGCPRDLDRHDNIVWRVVETSGLTVSLIPDQIHVSPALFRILHRLLPSESIFYVSDAMSAAGMPPGQYKLGALELEVGPDQVVRQPGKLLFAGSALRPIDGIMRAAEMLGCVWQDVWPRFSDVPARLMGLASGIVVGQPANLCVLEFERGNELRNLRVLNTE